MATALYDTDLHAWMHEQVGKLRRLREERDNLDLDIEHLVEEIESMAGSDRREVVNRLTIIVVHLLKLAYCFYPDPRQTWTNSVQAQRRSLTNLFEQSPSLRRLAPELLAKAYSRGVEQADAETIDLSMDQLPTVNPFPIEQVLDLAYIPEPPVRY